MRARIAAGGFLASLVLSASPAFAETSIEAGMVSGHLGEKVRVPLYTDFDAPVQEFSVVFFYDADRLRYLAFSLEGSETAAVDPLCLEFQDYGRGQGLAALRTQTIGPSRAFRVPPGRHLVGFLEFLVRATAAEGTAEVRPSQRIQAAAGETCAVIDTTETNYGYQSVAPDRLVPGSVTVLPPLGPRPVADLSCSQFLDRARLSFFPSESYGAVEVYRSGALVATLPGEATEWEEEIPKIGALHYELIARRAGEASLPASCDLLALTPAAPPVRDLACHARGRLSWKNPVSYDEIAIWRDGALIATVGGTAVSFEDPEAPAELAVYTVVAALSGFRSPETTCISKGVWILEAGDVEVPLGATRVAVPIYATTAKAVRAWDAYIDIDMSVFTLVADYEGGLEGSVGDPHPELYLIGRGPGPTGGPAVGMAWDCFGPIQPEKDLTPGLRQQLFRFIFEISGNVQEGDVFPVTFRTGSFTLRPAVAKLVDVFIAGSVRIGSPVAPVAGLKASVEAQPAGGDGAGAAGNVSPRSCEPGRSDRHRRPYRVDRLSLHRGRGDSLDLAKLVVHPTLAHPSYQALREGRIDLQPLNLDSDRRVDPEEEAPAREVLDAGEHRLRVPKRIADGAPRMNEAAASPKRARSSKSARSSSTSRTFGLSRFER